MTPLGALRDRLLLALGATAFTGCIAEQAIHEDAEPREMAPRDAAASDGPLTDMEGDVGPVDARVHDAELADARPVVDYATPEPCVQGDFRCAPQVDGGCLPTTDDGWRLSEFFEPTDSPVCGVDLHTGPFPPPAGETEPCCYCLTIQQCGGRPFRVAHSARLAEPAQRADWS
ncbi:MAG: hypothetical protein H6702_18330 [Myxococcales bacterium]|nr:hypothetical protein [Myxococcales bacterium]